MSMRLKAVAALLAGVLVHCAVVIAADKPQKPMPDTPKSRSDWPTERVVVIGQRGNIRDWLVNHTLRGSEGFADGSAPPAQEESRSEFPWQVYYAANGNLEARFVRIGAPVPHAPMEELSYVEFGKWRVDG